MKTEKFDEAVDEIVELIAEVHKLQMDQLKCNIKAVHSANVCEFDPKVIAEQILCLPIEIDTEPTHRIEPARPAIHLRDEMVCTAEKYVTIYSIGNLSDLSYVKVGSDKRYGKEFYHHCPEANGKLIRLIQDDAPIMQQCPICSQKYEQK